MQGFPGHVLLFGQNSIFPSVFLRLITHSFIYSILLIQSLDIVIIVIDTVLNKLFMVLSLWTAELLKDKQRAYWVQ